MRAIHRVIGRWKERTRRWISKSSDRSRWSRFFCLPRRRARGWRWSSTTLIPWTIMTVSPYSASRPRSPTSKFYSTDQNPPPQCSKRRDDCTQKSSSARNSPLRAASGWSATAWMGRQGWLSGTRLWRRWRILGLWFHRVGRWPIGCLSCSTGKMSKGGLSRICTCPSPSSLQNRTGSSSWMIDYLYRSLSPNSA